MSSIVVFQCRTAGKDEKKKAKLRWEEERWEEERWEEESKIPLQE